MEFALVVRELTKRRRLLALGVLVAAVAAVLSVYRLDGLKLKPRGLQHSSASTSVFVDSIPSALASNAKTFESLTTRATVYANLMASPAILNLIGQRVGIAGDRIYAAGPTDPLVPRVVEEPTSVERNVEITGETAPYRFNFDADPNLPTINIYAQAPTSALAIRLADGAVAGLQQYVSTLEAEQHVNPGLDVVIRPLGEATGGVSDPGIRKSVLVLTFLGVLLVWCVLMLVVSRFREAWRATGAVSASPKPESGEPRRTLGGSERYPASHGPADPTAHNGNGDCGQRVPDTVESAYAHPPLSGS
jgi:hypothetical protein